MNPTPTLMPFLLLVLATWTSCARIDREKYDDSCTADNDCHTASFDDLCTGCPDGTVNDEDLERYTAEWEQMQQSPTRICFIDGAQCTVGAFCEEGRCVLRTLSPDEYNDYRAERYGELREVPEASEE